MSLFISSAYTVIDAISFVQYLYVCLFVYLFAFCISESSFCIRITYQVYKFMETETAIGLVIQWQILMIRT